MHIEIKHRYTGAVLFSADAPNMRATVMFATQKGANLRDANLQGANLRSANLRGANLQDAYLQGANLQDADLQGANLRDAYLQGADLRSAYLQDADLQDANLRGANLQDAYLQDANLQDADLQDADLRSANLRSANLLDANLRGANLQGANLRDANLQGANLGFRSIIPCKGAFTGWKALANGAIVELEIPADARRISSLAGRKCRAERARVVAIYGEPGYSKHAPLFSYEVGAVLEPDSYDDDIRVECTHGIHFFITREEAEAYA